MELGEVLVWRIGEEKNDDLALTDKAAMIVAVGVATSSTRPSACGPYRLMTNWPKKQHTMGVALLWKAWKMIQLEEPQP